MYLPHLDYSKYQPQGQAFKLLMALAALSNNDIGKAFTRRDLIWQLGLFSWSGHESNAMRCLLAARLVVLLQAAGSSAYYYALTQAGSDWVVTYQSACLCRNKEYSSLYVLKD